MLSEPMCLTSVLSQLRNLRITWRGGSHGCWWQIAPFFPSCWDSLDCKPRTVWPVKPADAQGEAGAGRGVPVGTSRPSLPDSGAQSAWLGVFFSSSQRTGWFKLLSGGLWPCLFQECQPFLGQISERQAKRGCKLSSTAQPSAASARGAGAVLPLLPSLGTLPLCSSECLLPVRSVPLCIYAAPCKPPSVREPWGFSQH